MSEVQPWFRSLPVTVLALPVIADQCVDRRRKLGGGVAVDPSIVPKLGRCTFPDHR